MRLALISLERWDDIWRRNQHLCAQLVRLGLAESVVFVEPPVRGRSVATSRSPEPGVVVVTPPLLLPKRIGGLRLAAGHLRRTALHGVDLLWVNDPTLGVHCLSADRPAIYDVTDDWRHFDFPPRIVRRIVRAEDRLATRARTIVCSEVLRDRWWQRYRIQAPVVHNGIDAAAWATAQPRPLPGPGPHVGYLGTLHEERLDVALVLALADHTGVGTVHLVGPDALTPGTRTALARHPKIVIHGAVPAGEVPSWTCAMDVLISPHRISAFTLSLDAIKSYEYLASGRPIVATPTSGFQNLVEPGLAVTDAEEFVATVATSTGTSLISTRLTGFTWTDRAREFRQAIDTRQTIEVAIHGHQ